MYYHRGKIPFLHRLCARIGILVITMTVHTLHAQIAPHIVISEVYGGGGNSGSTYKNDFVELYNPTPTPVTMVKWSLQYATAAGSFTVGNRLLLNGTIPGHGYFLIQLAQGAGGTEDLPTPDVVGTLNISATAGKIALAEDTSLVTAPGGSNVIDFVGYGGANMYEGTAATPTLSNTTSAERKALGSSTSSSMGAGGSDYWKGNGWDSDDNASDFVVRTVQGPQNSAAEMEDTLVASVPYVMSANWNIVSLSIKDASTAVANLFPDRLSSAFAYESGYVAYDTLRFGSGYWVRMASGATYTATGSPRRRLSIPVVSGWNLIGGIGSDIPSSAVTSDPPGLLSSRFFGYNGVYFPSESLRATQGYWVKVSAPGVLHMSAFAKSGKSVAYLPDPNRDFNSIIVRDANGRSQALYFGSGTPSTAMMEGFDLPPVPPLGGFDVRFASHRYAETFQPGADGRSQLPIQIQADAYPLTVRWSIESGNTQRFSLEAWTDQGLVFSQGLSSTGQFTLTDRGMNRLVLELETNKDVPSTFSVSHGYPNPFNPAIWFILELPVSSMIEVAVYDLVGRRIRSLVHGVLPSGEHSISWMGDDDHGISQPGGVYFLHVREGGRTSVRKVVMMK